MKKSKPAAPPSLSSSIGPNAEVDRERHHSVALEAAPDSALGASPTESEAAFAALGAHPLLATALSARGFLTPTPVQAMVLGAPARDLLVSAPTGSGKTVAFGLVVGRQLLDAPAATTSSPRALVVAPTRELAAQVQRELTWLYQAAGTRVSAFTGGTDIRRDARALSGGVDVVVGTPGRLVDLVSRKSLDLSAVEVVVLDEADEMLDMGFREELEAVLAAVTGVHRTLLFSATLPPAIRALARRFQKDPLALDPRAGDHGAPHADIEHIAHLHAEGERLAALINVLLLADEPRAIVFCRTRETVKEIHHQLGLRGFSVEAISGERAQEERTRALEGLRQGQVRVLVATDVAARGLDLPELGLVVHADLPDTAESLTHRAGRTGRAGKKGRSVLLVERRAQRRAERLFIEARLPLGWTPPPTADAVAAHERMRLLDEVLAGVTHEASAPAQALAAELLATQPAARLLASLIEKLLAARPQGIPLSPIAPASRSPRAAPSGDGATDMVLFQINVGSRHNAQPNWLLPLICRRGGITRREVGAIRVTPSRTMFEVASRVATSFAAQAGRRDPQAPNVRIEPAEGASLPARSSTTLQFARPRASGKQSPGVHRGPRSTAGR